MSNLSIIILAAGQGTRMKSDLPKVLHQVGHKALLEHVILTSLELGSDDIHVVYGHGGDVVPQALANYSVDWVEQKQQLGTGHAVSMAIPAINDDDIVVVLYGDVPLIKSNTLKKLVAAAQNESLGLLTVTLDNPDGYGRIVRNAANEVVSIVEQKDANPQQLLINEINTGFLAAKKSRLASWLDKLDNKNAQGEYYLTDIIALAVADNIAIETSSANNINEVMGINDKGQLAKMERAYQQEQVEILMKQGATVRDPARVDLRGELKIGKDVVIDINVIFEGKVTLGDRVSVGAGSILRDVTVADDVVIKPYCIIEESEIGSACQIGPYSRIRPETRLEDQVHIGNFVEVKKSTIDSKSKINHLSYIGDTTMGSGVNIGAGTITCNYDGAYKHQTVIGNDVFVGSDTQLVAPVKIGDGATIGAGTTVTKEVVAEGLALSRAKQKVVTGWQRPRKKQ